MFHPQKVNFPSRLTFLNNYEARDIKHFFYPKVEQENKKNEMKEYRRNNSGLSTSDHSIGYGDVFNAKVILFSCFV